MMLTVDPEDRISAEMALQHDWIKQRDLKDANLNLAKEALGNL